jgi:hypothetical protein
MIATMRALLMIGLAVVVGWTSPAAAQGFTSNFANPWDASGGYASSLEFGDLYQATAIVTGTDMRQRPMGLAQCFREVMVKITGEPRLAKDKRLDELAEHPEPYLVAFDYRDMMAGQKPKDDQGTADRPHALTTRFEAAKIDKLVADLGEHVWRANRPVLAPVVSIKTISGRTFLLSLDNPDAEGQRISIGERARELGMTVRVPTDADLASWGVAPGGMSAPARAAAGGEVFVAGTLEFKEAAPGWEGHWQMRWRDRDYAWQVAGVNYDAAFRILVAGAMRIASGRDGPE